MCRRRTSWRCTMRRGSWGRIEQAEPSAPERRHASPIQPLRRFASSGFSHTRRTAIDARLFLVLKARACDRPATRKKRRRFNGMPDPPEIRCPRITRSRGASAENRRPQGRGGFAAAGLYRTPAPRRGEWRTNRPVKRSSHGPGHEAYLVSSSPAREWANRAHFFAAAAEYA